MLISHVEKEILNISSNDLKSNFSIQLAYSGGMDSSCLLDVLYRLKKKIGFNLFITYVSYSKSSYSLAVLNHIKSLPSDIVKIVRVVEINSQYNFESEARKIRYSIFKDIAKANKINYTFTAHHMRDQLETLLMKFVDGSDLISMSGIRKEVNGIFRPILEIDKGSIRKYAKKHKISYFDDPSNEDIRFRRNKIRKIIIPSIMNDKFLLNKLIMMNKQSIKMITMSSDVIKADLKYSVIEFSDKLGFVCIRLDRLKNYDIILLKLFLKSTIKKYFNIDYIQKSNSFWLECMSFINNSKVGARLNLLKRIYLLKDRGSIFIVNSERSYNKAKKKIRFGKQNKLDLGTVFSTDSKIDEFVDKYSYAVSRYDFQNGIFARKWRHGDRVKLDSGSKMVSDLFIDFKLPLFKKNIYPIFENSKMEIVWIPGIYIKKQSTTLKRIVINWKE